MTKMFHCLSACSLDECMEKTMLVRNSLIYTVHSLLFVRAVILTPIEGCLVTSPPSLVLMWQRLRIHVYHDAVYFFAGSLLYGKACQILHGCNRHRQTRWKEILVSMWESETFSWWKANGESVWSLSEEKTLGE